MFELLFMHWRKILALTCQVLKCTEFKLKLAELGMRGGCQQAESLGTSNVCVHCDSFHFWGQTPESRRESLVFVPKSGMCHNTHKAARCVYKWASPGFQRDAAPERPEPNRLAGKAS